jgi:hypothetical protein
MATRWVCGRLEQEGTQEVDNKMQAEGPRSWSLGPREAVLQLTQLKIEILKAQAELS